MQFKVVLSVRSFPAPSIPLLDADLPRRLLMRFRHHHAQDPILQARLDRILINTAREREAAVELAHRALRDPVLEPLLALRLLLLVLDDLGAAALGGRHAVRALVLHGRLVVLVAFARLGDLALLGPALDGGTAAGVLALGTALDDEGVVVGELDGHVLLVDARELAVQEVRLLLLAHVEFGLESADGGRATGSAVGARAGSVVVIVVEEAEERSEVALGHARAKERHGARSGWCCENGCLDCFADLR